MLISNESSQPLVFLDIISVLTFITKGHRVQVTIKSRSHGVSFDEIIVQGIKMEEMMLKR